MNRSLRFCFAWAVLIPLAIGSAATASGQTSAAAPESAPASSEPPWPPPPVDENTTRLIEQMNAAASQPASAPVTETAPVAPQYTQPLPPQPQQQPATTPPAGYPPSYPPGYAPGYAPPHAPVPAPVPDPVRHARAFAVVGAQFPLALAWSTAAAATSLIATSFLLAAPTLPLLPLGLAIAATPFFVSLAGSAISSLATVGLLPLVDLIFKAPPVPDNALLTTALIAGAYAALIGIVAGVPLSIPPLFAAARVSTGAEASTIMTYALVAALIPLAAAPMAQLEAANEGGYQADLPLWCWYAMQICSVGTYYLW